MSLLCHSGADLPPTRDFTRAHHILCNESGKVWIPPHDQLDLFEPLEDTFLSDLLSYLEEGLVIGGSDIIVPDIVERLVVNTNGENIYSLLAELTDPDLQYYAMATNGIYKVGGPARVRCFCYRGEDSEYTLETLFSRDTYEVERNKFEEGLAADGRPTEAIEDSFIAAFIADEIANLTAWEEFCFEDVLRVEISSESDPDESLYLLHTPHQTIAVTLSYNRELAMPLTELANVAE